MPGPDADAVRAAAARWIWVPVDATEVWTDDYRLTHYTDYSSVQWSTTDRPLKTLLAEIVGHARAAGSPRLRWWVDERTRPEDTEARLRALGLEPAERLEVLALPVDAEVPVPDDVEVVEVRDREGVVLAGRIQSEVFDMSPPTAAQVDDLTRSVTAPEAERQIRCYVAYVDEAPVAFAGSTVDGDALRFWDGSVVPDSRGRGAYRALVARRLRDARATTGRLRAGQGGRRHLRCHVAYVDEAPVASAGSTVDGDALRFWDGSVVPDSRGRGAYRALVARRLRDARATTADFALVKAVDATSAPILRRLGFTSYGESRCWSLALR